MEAVVKVRAVENVVVIRPQEDALFDRARLAGLGRSMGREAAARVAERAIEDVAERICAIELAWRAGEFGRMSKTARALIAIAEQIGMVGVAEVANDVCVTLGNRDEAALAAVVARLTRVGGQSLGSAARAEILSL